MTLDRLMRRLIARATRKEASAFVEASHPIPAPTMRMTLMKIQIKNWYSGNVLFETDAESIGAAVVAAIAAKANLSGANLSGANLSAEELSRIISQRTILADGEIIGWKKIRGKNGSHVICKLKIPAKAKRVGGLIGRKCRAEYANVISGSGHSSDDKAFVYKPGKRVKPDKFDPNPMVECSSGIHFFITRAEAEAYDL